MLLTWVTAATKGAETVVTGELAPDDGGTQYEQAWPNVLEQFDRRMTAQV